jgi:hypothetical protein
MLLEWKMFLSTVTKLGVSATALDTHLFNRKKLQKLRVWGPFLQIS